MVHPIRYTQTELQPNASWRGPTASSPIEAVMLPHPLMRPVTVPSDLLLPRTLGWDAKSAATADVMMLFGLQAKRKARRARQNKEPAQNIHHYCSICYHTTLRVSEDKQTRSMTTTYPPTRMPMQASIAKSGTGPIPPSEYTAKTARKTTNVHMKVPITTARRPPKRSETCTTTSEEVGRTKTSREVSKTMARMHNSEYHSKERRRRPARKYVRSRR